MDESARTMADDKGAKKSPIAIIGQYVDDVKTSVLVAGLLWFSLYYAFIVRAIPNIKLEDLPLLAITIFGCLAAASAAAGLLLPGLLLREAFQSATVPDEVAGIKVERLLAWDEFREAYSSLPVMMLLVSFASLPLSLAVYFVSLERALGDLIFFAEPVIIWGLMLWVVKSAKLTLRLSLLFYAALSWATIAFIAVLFSAGAVHAPLDVVEQSAAILTLIALVNLAVMQKDTFFGAHARPTGNTFVACALALYIVALSGGRAMAFPFQFLKIGGFTAALSIKDEYLSESGLKDNCFLRSVPSLTKGRAKSDTLAVYVIDSLGDDFSLRCWTDARHLGSVTVLVPKSAVSARYYGVEQAP
jgi:hypothetical protein